MIPLRREKYLMMLKLDSKEGVTILVVQSSITSRHLPILKAGLTKLIKSGKLSIVLDLMGLKETDLPTEADRKEILSYRQYAQSLGGQLLVASPIVGIGHATTLEAAVKTFGTLLANLQAKEKQLLAEYEALKKRKETLDDKLQSLVGDDIKTLRRENSVLKKSVKALEDQVTHYFKIRSNPMDLASVKTKLATVQATLKSVLEQEGVLSVDGGKK